MYSDVFFIQNSWFIQHGLWANTAQQIAHSSHVLTQRVLYYSLSNKIELKPETTIYLFASGITVIKKFKIKKKKPFCLSQFRWNTVLLSVLLSPKQQLQR